MARPWACSIRLASDSPWRARLNRWRRRVWHLLAHRIQFGERADDGRVLAATRIAPTRVGTASDWTAVSSGGSSTDGVRAEA